MASHPANFGIEQLLADCDVWRGRRGGPGGQHRNKVETGVRLVHGPTGVSGAATESRSPADNQRKATFRLRVNLALEVRAFVGDEVSECWQSRCRGGRLSINPSHRDFPALLAEALDVIAYYGGEVSDAAQWLRCTATQLVKLLKHEPRALAWVNARRAERGRPALR